VQYGFVISDYKSYKNEDGDWVFSTVMESQEHGTMTWSGVKKSEKISGDYTWVKKGQDTIHYTFKGKLK